MNTNIQSLKQHKKVLDKLRILFENDDYMIVDKQAGIIVNRSDTTRGEQTLQDLIEEYIQNTQKTLPRRQAGQIAGKSEIQLTRTSDRSDNLTNRKSESPSIPSSPNDSDIEFRNRSGIVHRLDKETSGVLVVAKNSAVFRNLQAQFKERKVDKSYIALAHGKLSPQSGEINAPVGRLPWNRKRFGVVSGGREAITKYQVSSIKYLVSNGIREALSLVRLSPKTGRTHQIRVHLKHIGHPIFGDPLYGGRKTSKQDRKILQRVFLHAEKIKFQDPSSGREVEYSSELPEDLRDLLEKLEIKKDN